MFNFLKVKNTEGKIREYRDLIVDRITLAHDKKCISTFEMKAFLAFCTSAEIASSILLSNDALPFVQLRTNQDQNAIADTFFFLCVVFLHDYTLRRKQVDEVAQVQDVDDEVLFSHFAQFYDGQNKEERTHVYLETFNIWAFDENRDIRDMFFNQGLMFGEILSIGKINFGEIFKNDVKTTLILSLVTWDMHSISWNVFDEMVLGKPRNELSFPT